MQTEDLLKLANWANARTRAVIPYSANFYNSSTLIPPQLSLKLSLDRLHKKDPRYQRKLSEDYFPNINSEFLGIGLDIVRCDAKDKKAKQVLNEILQWHLNYSQTGTQSNLDNCEVWLDSLQKYVKFDELSNLIDSLNKHKLQDDLQWIEKKVVRSIKAGVGNCDEVSSAALLFLAEYPASGLPDLPAIDAPVRIERVGFPENKADHIFLLLNRKKGDLNDPLSWNEDTVICDPWTNEAYTVKQLLTQKKELLELFLTTELKKPSGEYYIGDKFNKVVHSDKWLRKHAAKTNKKFWRPLRLLDLEKRPEFLERSPKIKKSFDELMDLLCALPEQQRLIYLATHVAMVKPIISTQSELNQFLGIIPRNYQKEALKQIGFANIISAAEKFLSLTDNNIVGGILIGIHSFFLSTMTEELILKIAKEDNAATICAELLAFNQPCSDYSGLELLANSPDLIIQMLTIKNKDGRTAFQELMRIEPNCLSVAIQYLEEATDDLSILAPEIPHIMQALKGENADTIIATLFDYILKAAPNFSAFLDYLLEDNGKALIQMLQIFTSNKEGTKILLGALEEKDSNGCTVLQCMMEEKPEVFLCLLDAIAPLEYRIALTKCLIGSHNNSSCLHALLCCNDSDLISEIFPKILEFMLQIPNGRSAIAAALSKDPGDGWTVLNLLIDCAPEQFKFLLDFMMKHQFLKSLVFLLNTTIKDSTDPTLIGLNGRQLLKLKAPALVPHLDNLLKAQSSAVLFTRPTNPTTNKNVNPPANSIVFNAKKPGTRSVS